MRTMFSHPAFMGLSNLRGLAVALIELYQAHGLILATTEPYFIDEHGEVVDTDPGFLFLSPHHDVDKLDLNYISDEMTILAVNIREHMYYVDEVTDIEKYAGFLLAEIHMLLFEGDEVGSKSARLLNLLN